MDLLDGENEINNDDSVPSEDDAEEYIHEETPGNGWHEFWCLDQETLEHICQLELSDSLITHLCISFDPNEPFFVESRGGGGH